MQTGIVEQHLAGSREQRIASMQEKIMQFASAGVPADAVPFLNDIRGILATDILGAIITEKDNTVSTHTNLYSQFATASADFVTAQGNVGSAATENQAHSECRAQESIDHGQKTTCDGEQHAAQVAFNNAESSVLSLGVAEDVCGEVPNNGWSVGGASATNLQAYLAAGTAAIDRRGELETKTTECNGLTNELNAQTDLCDTAQTGYEAAACTVALNTKRANDAYNEAYGLAQTNFENEFAGWDAQDADRLSQCQLVNTLICMVDALVAEDDSVPLQAAVQVCNTNSNSHDCTAVSFTHSSTPVADTLAVVPAAPCAAEFVYFENGWPAGTSEGHCTACVGL